MNSRPLSEFEANTGIEFGDRCLLRNAFVHSSYANEVAPGHVSVEDNERLEFLGDAVLEFVVSRFLYARYPELSEGELTRLRAALVRKETLASVARSKEMGDYLLLGRGEEESGGRSRDAILCATYEAFVGALFLDQGIDAVARFVLPDLGTELEAEMQRALGKDAKSRLQEWSQAQFGAAPRYRVLESSGPDHAKTFIIEVTLLGHRCGVGEGTSKQEASQSAASQALEALGQAAADQAAQAITLAGKWPVADDLVAQLAEVAASKS